MTKSEQIFNMTPTNQNITYKVSKNQKTNKKILKNKTSKNRVKAKNRQQTKYTHSCRQKYVRKWGWRLLLLGKMTVAEI